MFDIFNQWVMSAGFNEISSGLIIWSAIVTAVVFFSWVSNFLVKHCIVKFLHDRLTSSHKKYLQVLATNNLFVRFSHFAPAMVIYLSIPLLEIDGFPVTETIAHVVERLTQIYFVVVIFLVESAFLSCIDDVYNHSSIASRKPIKSYLQVIKLFLFAVMVVFIVSIILHKSPVAFLTGLGALTAVLMLVFRDTILGFVASIQLATYDMVRIGDWIEMNEFGVDGDVVDMSLNTIKVKNFDKTIVTIPTYSLLTHGVKNWRGMNQSGGRRIKRSIYIDIHSIRFCSEEDSIRLSKISLIKSFIKNKIVDINEFNQSFDSEDRMLSINGRNLTNIGLFRKYLEIYLQAHPDVNQSMTLMVRQLDPTSSGLPIEIYVFANTTQWKQYEEIQSDIFDHALACIHYFDLRLFQNISTFPVLQTNIE